MAIYTTFFFRVAPDLVSRLRSARAADLEAWADGWAAAMSTPHHTHSVDGARLAPDWTREDALALLTPLRELAQRAGAEERMFLLIEP